MRGRAKKPERTCARIFNLYRRRPQIATRRAHKTPRVSSNETIFRQEHTTGSRGNSRLVCSHRVSKKERARAPSSMFVCDTKIRRLRGSLRKIENEKTSPSHNALRTSPRKRLYHTKAPGLLDKTSCLILAAAKSGFADASQNHPPRVSRERGRHTLSSTCSQHNHSGHFFQKYAVKLFVSGLLRNFKTKCT